jgi:hypothetical protein
MSLMFDFDTFMSEKIKPAFEAGKIKNIEKVHFLSSAFLRKWIDKNKVPGAFGLNDKLFVLAELMHRLELLEKLGRQGCDNLCEYSAFLDLSNDILERETGNMREILEEINKEFPQEAVDLDY